ncbi:YihY family inner membrane protein [Coralloluteibacterium thermophilus]|uniref:UPF0761 membrane protein ACFO3Q_07070 n=1 Tax=Coralloluteibacterium thermophilum TaxID=2707049 RepID=A0ABV9NJC3_9GAMM
MQPLTVLRAWAERIDRERIRSFSLFLWRRFRDDRCLEVAGSLSYTTVFALVPLATAVFGVLSAFPVFSDWSERLTHFVFQNFVPGSARAVEEYLTGFAAAASRLTMVGVITLLAIALWTMASVEATFNRIWRVRTTRPSMTRFLVYWTVLTLGALMAVAALAASSFLFALPGFSGLGTPSLVERLLRLLPWLIELAVFTLAYAVIPNRTVALRHAVAGGLLATVLFEAAKWGFALYLRNASYQQIYGALAVLPIFLFWLYLSWVVVLLGATFAAALSAFRYQPAAMRLPPGYELFGMLRLLGRLRQARARGRGLRTDIIHLLEPCLTDDMLQRMLGELADIRVVQRSEHGEWLLTRDLDDISLDELYESAALRVPIAEARLPCRDDALGRAAAAALDDLRLPMRDALRRSVGSYLNDIEEPALP